MNEVLINALMYGVALVLTTYLLLRRVKLLIGRKVRVPKPQEAPKYTYSQVIALIKVVSIVLKTPATALSLSVILIILLISALSSGAVLASKTVTIEPTGKYLIIIELSENLPQLITHELNFKELRKMIRVVLEEPLNLRVGSETLVIYSVLGLDTDYGPLNVSRECYVGAKEFSSRLLKIRDKLVPIKYLGNFIYELRIVDGVTLLKPSFFLGSKPIFVPLENTLVTSFELANELLNASVPITYVIEFMSSEELNATVPLLLKYKEYISEFIIVHNDTLITYFGTPIPSTEGVVTSIISAAIASLIILPSTHAQISKIKEVEERLVIIGFPIWSLSLIALFAVISPLIMMGIVFFLITPLVFEPPSVFTSLISYVITALTVTAFSKIEVSKIYAQPEITPATHELTLVLSEGPHEVLSKVDTLLRRDEFFDVIKIDKYCRDDEGYLYGVLRFKKAWGLGANVEVMVSRVNDGYKVSISVKPWSIEEISDKYMELISKMVLSKVHGGLRV